MSAALRRSFDSLEVPNYRRYFAGQLISLSGTWMQTVAAIWLILTLTGSGVAVGLTTALQFLPMLLFGAWGGVLADRIPRRRLLIATQALMAIPAIGLFVVTATGVVAPWMVFLAVFAMGSVNAIDNPARQSFVFEMVGPDRVVNAVSLNSVIVQMARIAGPALAGLLIAGFGVVPCFALNALTFVAMIVALWGMDPRRLHTEPLAPREPGAIRAGLRYVRATPELAVPLALMALVGTLGFNFQVVLPLLAKFSFGGDASTYAAMVSAMAVGSIAGALVNGAHGRPGPRLIAGGALAFGVLALLSAAMPALALELGALTLLGAAAVTFAATINSSLQLAVEPQMRGRVMALYSVVFLGSTPIGGPLAGWLAQTYDPRAALLLAAVSGLAAAWAAHISFSRIRTRAKPSKAQGEPATALTPAGSRTALWSDRGRGCGGHSPLLSDAPPPPVT
ncbi:MAG TPA: MFS transporter [Solirubrobacterales bacterium]|nr:MFS transporter [Solirubrobacterales bacterium]